MLIFINVHNHINTEFGKCQKNILDDLDFLKDRIDIEEWEDIRKTVFKNINSVKRNVCMVLDGKKVEPVESIA